MDKLMLISERVIAGLLAMYTAAFIVNAVGQVTGAFSYVCPDDLIQLCQVILGASTGVWSIAWITAYRENQEKKKLFDEERVATIEPGKVLITDVTAIEHIKDDAVVLTITTEKYHETPAPFNQDLSIPSLPKLGDNTYEEP